MGKKVSLVDKFKEFLKQKEFEKQLKKQIIKEEKVKKKLEDIVDKKKEKNIEAKVDVKYGTEEISSYIPKIGSFYSYKSHYNERKGVKEEYDSMISADTKIAWQNDIGDGEIMKTKEIESYMIKEAVNLLVGSGVNHVSYEEKIKFSAYMTNPHNKITFMINYSLLGLSSTVPNPPKKEEIREKVMKNDLLVATRIDVNNEKIDVYSK